MVEILGCVDTNFRYPLLFGAKKTSLHFCVGPCFADAGLKLEDLGLEFPVKSSFWIFQRFSVPSGNLT